MNPSQQRTAEGLLFTDQYQLTMAQLYFRLGLHGRPAQFEHFFRRYPNYGSHQAELSEIEPLLVADLPDLDVLRGRRQAGVARLDPGVRRLVTPHIYHVSLSQRLWDLKQALIREAKGEE